MYYRVFCHRNEFVHLSQYYLFAIMIYIETGEWSKRVIKYVLGLKKKKE